jgi:hypothetical protein
MPFKSKNQQKACYATKGFRGKVDCNLWSVETPKGKKLPQKVKKKK